MPHTEQETIESFVAAKLTMYFEQLQGKQPCNVYSMVIDQAEAAVIRHVVQHCGNNQSKAATLLGISRSALRNKIQKYDI